MLLLRENLTFDSAKVLLEEKIEEGSNVKSLFMKGIFVQGGVKNHNQRIYPLNEIRKAVDSINEQITDGNSVFGECDHPEELNINIDRISHMITEMYMDGPNGCGKLKIVPTPMGNIVKTLLESGGKLGVSSRGSGSVNESGNVSDFEMITVDIVCRPSAPQAYPVPVYETYNHRRGTVIRDLAESMQHDKKAQEYLKKELINFINSLK
jgi:hypothetical protein